MFSATYFTYDGTHSSVFGLQMLDFNDESVTETTAFSPVLTLNKTKASKRFFFGGIYYDQAPQHTFSVISATAISDTARKGILSWLVGRNEFKKLVIHQEDLENYWYNCIFTNVDIIYINGVCHGFRLTATFDSPYQYGEPSVFQTKLPKNVAGLGLTVTNNSALPDQYIYPTIEIKDVVSSEITIVNHEDYGKVLKLTGLHTGDTIIVDGELRTINSAQGYKYLGGCNKKWLRLKPGGTAILTIGGECSDTGYVKVTIPTYVMIGF